VTGIDSMRNTVYNK